MTLKIQILTLEEKIGIIEVYDKKNLYVKNVYMRFNFVEKKTADCVKNKKSL